MYLFYMTQLTGTKSKSFQQQSKLIELKFISATSPHWLTLTNKTFDQSITLKTLNFL